MSTIKEQVLDALKNIKVMLGAQEEPKPKTVTTKDGKEVSFEGELKEGTELKLGDQSLSDGTYELNDDRKMEVKDGKFVNFVTESGDDSELVALKAVVESQKNEIAGLKAEFKSVLEATNKTVEVVEKIALALESEEAPAGGGDKGDGMISKSEWVVNKVKATK